jgi:hypothetical protein
MRASITPARFHAPPPPRPAHGGSRHSRPARTGARLRFTVFPDAWVEAAIDAVRSGHLVGSQCVPSTRRSRRPAARRCSILSQIATLEHREGAGRGSIYVSGAFRRRLGLYAAPNVPFTRAVPLTHGRYVAVLTASDTSGTSAPVSVPFTILP